MNERMRSSAKGDRSVGGIDPPMSERVPNSNTLLCWEREEPPPYRTRKSPPIPRTRSLSLRPRPQPPPLPHSRRRPLPVCLVPRRPHPLSLPSSYQMRREEGDPASTSGQAAAMALQIRQRRRQGRLFDLVLDGGRDRTSACFCSAE